MKTYFKQLKKLSHRPILNGSNGVMKNRYATPLELFFDLIFVIALGSITHIFSSFTFSNILFGILIYSTMYSTWFYLTIFNVMYMKQDINYLLRLILFLIMLPMIFLLSIDNLDTASNIQMLVGTLGITKFMLAIAFRDSISSTKVKYVGVTKTYKMVSIFLIVSSLLLMSVIFVPKIKYLMIILSLVFLIEMLIINLYQKKIEKKFTSTILIDKKLLSERQLLFLILIFGEGLISLIHSISFESGIIKVLNLTLFFAITYLFYIRIYEETHHNEKMIQNSTNAYKYFLLSLNILILFLILGSIPQIIINIGYIPFKVQLTLFCLLSYICITHIIYNFNRLKEKIPKKNKIFHSFDLYMLTLMQILLFFIFIIDGQGTYVYLLVFIFFLLHVIALPFRPHLR